MSIIVSNQALLEFCDRLDTNKILPTGVKDHVCEIIFDNDTDILIAEKVLFDFIKAMELQMNVENIGAWLQVKQLDRVLETLVDYYPEIDTQLLSAISAEKWRHENFCYDSTAINYYNTLVKAIIELYTNNEKTVGMSARREKIPV